MSEEGRSETPATLKPYIAHGVHLRIRGSEAIGDCPFCGSEGKFSVNIEKGTARCFNGSCDSGTAGGGYNTHTFIRRVWQHSHDTTEHNWNNGQRERLEEDYGALAIDRELLSADTLRQWGILRSHITREWMIPGYSTEGSLNQLYRYILDPANKGLGRRVVRATPETNQCLIGLPLVNKDAETVYICEGPFDGMSLWETLAFTKLTIENEGNEDSEIITLEYTDDVSESMLKDSTVLAVPSCNVFLPSWCQLLHNKNVVILFDNDYPKINKETGKASEPAGLAGTRRIALMLLASDTPPKSVQYLSWHPASESYDPSRKDGYDVRDLLSDGVTCEQRIDKLGQLIEMIRDVPDSWKPEGQNALVYHASDLACTPCDSYEEVVNEWSKAAEWSEGHDRAYSVGLSCILSTEARDDQLWCKIVAPSGSGKSMLCAAFATNKRYTKEVNILTGFHSGWQNKGDDESTDNSLIHQIDKKTMITKDGDTLLQQPNLQQILSQARDIYDGASQSYYRTGKGRAYKNVRMTWILCGTSSLHKLDSSELGERFIDCVIMKDIDQSLEEAILWRKANQAARMKIMDSKTKTYHDDKMERAMALTGGYINYLRGNAQKLLDQVEVEPRCIRYCMSLARIASYLRCRPSKSQNEEVEREIPTRLVSQLMRLAKCCSVVINRQEIDSEVMRRVRQCAIDTSRGRTFEICSKLYKYAGNGLETREVAALTNQPEEEESKMLRHLKKIDAVHGARGKVNGVYAGHVKWRLSPTMYDLFREVIASGY